MKPIQDILNKIKWTGEDAGKYTLGIYDRVKDAIFEIKMKDIIALDKISMNIHQNNKEVDIPFHRIRKVWKNNELVWER